MVAIFIRYTITENKPNNGRPFFEDHHFSGENFSEHPLPKGEYENCSFVNCNFAACNLSQYVFDRCAFDNCNLSSVNIAQSALREISFYNCKMLGIHFDTCNPFLFSLFCEGCMLNLSSFYKMNIKGIRFKNCSLQEVDFSEADLSNVLFAECDLMGAIFDNTRLLNSDFRTAKNFAIQPEKNKLRKTRFSNDGLAGLLSHLDLIVD